jgi:DNA-binding transcriptional regulator YiaG
VKKPEYRSEVAAAVHEGVRGMHRLEFDVRCLTVVEDLSAADIQALREREGVSQAILARCLNVTPTMSASLNAARSGHAGQPSSCFG